MVFFGKRTLQTTDGALLGSPSVWAFCSSELADAGAVPPASPSDFTSPLGTCFKGRSILKVMAVEVQYSSNPYRYLHESTEHFTAPLFSFTPDLLKVYPAGRKV